MKATSIDHICIAVHDLGKARKVYEETLGLDLALEYVAESEKIRVARYYFGEGVFLISYRGDDVEKGLSELRARGEKTIDATPRTLMGNRYAFIQPPKRMCGVLTEIIDGKFDPNR